MDVYSAAQPEYKDSFLAEFVSSQTPPLIRSPDEKNNDRFDSRWPLLFNACIESLNIIKRVGTF
jgi:hypothetical protein